jgi:formylglycine-generating enzyme required for sulfatase activity
VVVAPAGLAVVARAGPMIRRPKRKVESRRAVAWVAAVVVLLAGLGGGWALFGSRPNTPDTSKAGERVAQNQPDPDTQAVVIKGVDLQPKATEPRKEEDRPKDTGASRPPDKPDIPEKPPEKPNVPEKPPVKPADPPRPPDPPKPADPPRTPAVGDPIVNSVKMTLAYIPKGEFSMGAGPKEIMALEKEPRDFHHHRGEEPETPRLNVKITKSFYMGIYEVTQGQYEQVMGVNPSRNQASKDHPVERVTWDDAKAFCQKLGEMPEEKKAGRRYRLPTEAEWEYACRAGTTTAFHTGESLSSKQANFDGRYPFPGSDKGLASVGTVKVGTYKPNAWGLYDMHGNVWEWCLDGPRPYADDGVPDPRGPETADGNRVVRGGSWKTPACRAALRQARPPHDFVAPDYGFRVVCEQ